MKTGKRGDHLYKNGLREGYTEYRYGAGSKKLPLASVSIQKPKPIYKGKDRERVLSFVYGFMRQWQTTPFQYEGAAVAGLRSALCLKGYNWNRSDAEAVSLAQESLRKLSADRPSWNEGQWEYSASRTNCLQCGGWLDDHDQAMSRRFCSAECAKGLMTFRAEWADKQTSLAYNLAWKEHNERTAPGRQCKHCGTTFHGRSKDREFCSRECWYQSSRTLIDKPCSQCGELFHPRSDAQRFCSLRCDGIAKAQEYRKTAPERACPICCSVFRPSTSHQIYCSKACSRSRAVRAQEYQKSEWRDVNCASCGTVFRSNKKNAKYCSRPCLRFDSRIKSGQLPKLFSASVFDYFFKQAA